MESASAAPKHVDESLWWESFVDLFDELDKVSPVEGLPDHLAEKLRRNHSWFLNSVSRFKPPDQASRLALDFPELIVGSHRIVVKPDLKEAALRASGFLGLNEVQSYILLYRSSAISNSVADVEDKEFLYSVLFQYFHERQGLLQCTGRIFLNALHASDGFLSKEAFMEVISLLVCDGFVQKLLASFHDVLLSVSSDYSEVDLKILWADEVLIEGNLLMDTLLLAYYDGICSCNVEQWKTICSLFMDVLFGSLNIGKVAVSVESRSSFAHMKAKMLLILIETLDLENLLYLIHDGVPFSKGGSVFSVTDIKEMDGQISCFSDLGEVEVGPLFLAWAVFLRLVLSLPETHNNITLMEIDHISYVRQAIEVGSFDYLLQILCDGSFRDSDGPVCGFFSVMRTLMSAFIASYELSLQKEDNTLTKILDILYQIYNGQESLVVQFWDKNSFVDSPIRSILSMLEKEYPINIAEFLRFLSALCEGSWPAECVYNYLNKMSGITTFYEVPSAYRGMSISDIIETDYPVEIPGVEGLTVPSGSCGRVLKFLSPNIAVVHWECAHSGILLLVLLLTQEIRSDNIEGVLYTLKLLYKMISFNKALAFSLMSLGKLSPIQNSIRLEMVMRVDLVKIICTLIFKFVHNAHNLQILSISLNILTEMLKCAPSHVIEAVVESNIFGIRSNEISSDSWMLNALARMLIEEPGVNDDSYALAGSVLDFTIQLLEIGAEDRLVSPLIVFSLQYVSVNHMQWKCKSENSRWNVTLKVFELMRSCIKATKVSQKLHCIIWGIFLNDSSIHNMLCRILCMSAAILRSYMSHHCESKEIDYVQDAICYAFDVLCCIMADISQFQDISSNASAFIQTMLSPSVRPLPVVHAAVSLISYTENSAIQVAAARALSSLCYIASRFQSYSVENISLVSESVKIKELRTAVFCILEKEVKNNGELVTAIFDLLTAIAYYQPALLSSLIVYDKNVDLSSGVACDSVSHLAAVSVVENLNSSNCHLIDVILNYMKDSEILLHSDPLMLLSILNFLKALWEGSVRFTSILEKIRSSQKFWEQLASLISPTHVKTDGSSSKLDSSAMQFLSLRYRCQGNILEIMAYELFFQQKEIQCDNQPCAVKVNGTSGHSNPLYAQEIISTWFDSPFLENLIKSYSDIKYFKEDIFRAKVSICVCIVHLISKLASGDSGSLSISLVKKISEIYNKLKGHSAFSSLLSQYALRGYSGENGKYLVISDLYYLLQGKLEGREITSGPFQELSHFLLSMRTFECNDEKSLSNFFLPRENIQLFDIKKIREEFRAGLWDRTDWKTSKEIAERMFMHMQFANLSASIANSKHFSLKALVSVVSVYRGNMNSTKQTLNGSGISKPAIECSIRYLCNCSLEISDSLVLEPHNLTQCFLSIFTTQLELFLILSLILFKLGSHRTNDRPLLPLSVLIMKSCGSVIKVSVDARPLTPVLTLKLLLTLLLISLEVRNHLAHTKDVEDFEAQASLTSIGLLPVLCKYTENVEYCNLSIASIDIIIKDLSPDTWLPILKEHLPLQLILQNVQERDVLASAPVILNFLLTLGHTKGGAEMLYSGKFISAIMALLSQLNDDSPLLGKLDKNNINSLDRERQLHIWALSMAVTITMIQSLGDDSIYQDAVVSALCYFFSEKPYMLSFYFSAMDCLDEDHRNKKRTQAHVFHISLSALKLTEHTLMLLCLLAKYKSPWVKGMKGMDSKLRETVIHILALISRAGQRIGDSSDRSSSLFCRPTTKEEFELNKRPSYIKSRHGWFIRSAINFLDRAMSYDNSENLPLVITTRASNTADLDCRSYFTDTVVMHIYRIAFLILNLLCMQTKEAVRRADEVEFVDLAKFPELPSPEILHCLQDQAVSIVTELCGANRQDPIEPEIQNACCLLLQILEKSLYLELCVTQTCGIRPVLGRAEDFSKEIRRLINVVDRHPDFGQALRSSEQIIALLYPGMLQTSNSDGVRL